MSKFLEHWLVNEWYNEALYRKLYPDGLRAGVIITRHILKRVKERVGKKLSENIVFEAIDRGIRFHELGKDFPWLISYWHLKLWNSPKNSVIIYYNQKIFVLISGYWNDQIWKFPTHTFVTCMDIPHDDKSEFQKAWKKLRKKRKNSN